MLANMAGPESVLARLGVITFATGTVTVQGPPGLTKLGAVPWARDARMSQPAMSFFLKENPPEQETLLKRQVELIQSEVGATNAGDTPVAIATAPPGGSAILTVILLDV
jgi:hypothetical protein